MVLARGADNVPVAVKVVRAIDKYRTAARAEVEVLSALRAFDPTGLSYCVTLRRSFEWRGHVCMGMFQKRSYKLAYFGWGLFVC